MVLYLFGLLMRFKNHDFQFSLRNTNSFIKDRFFFLFQQRNVKRKLITEARTGAQLDRRCVWHMPKSRSLWLGTHGVGSQSFQFSLLRRIPPALRCHSGFIQGALGCPVRGAERECALHEPTGRRLFGSPSCVPEA